jgi:hypothetical protein
MGNAEFLTKRFDRGQAFYSVLCLRLACVRELAPGDPSSGGPAEGGRAAECNSAIRHSTAKPHPKERGVYAASTLEVPQAVNPEWGLENLNAEAA